MHRSKVKVLAFLFVSVCLTGRNGANKTPLYVGGLFQTMALENMNRQMVYGPKHALEFVNANLDILPDYELLMIENFTDVNLEKMTADALHILYGYIYDQPQLIMLVVSSISMVAQPVCEVASQYNLVQISGTASSPGFADQERYPLFLRLYPSDTILVPGWEALLRNFGWKKVAIFFEHDEIFSLLMKGLVSLLEDRGGYNVLTVEHVQHGFEPTNQMRSLKNHDARIIIVLAYPGVTRQIMCEAYRTDLYGEKYVWILLGWLNSGWHLERVGDNDITCSNEEMISAINGYLSIKVLSYTPDFNEVNFNGVKPRQQDFDVYNYMRSNYYFAGFGYDTVICMALALNKSENILSQLDPPRRLTDFTYQNAEMAKYIRDSMQGLEVHGVTGKIEFTTTGDRVSELMIEQMQEDNKVQVGMYDVSNDAFSWSSDNSIRWHGKFPPTDGVQKVYATVLPSSIARIVMYTLACFGILFAVVCLVLNIKFRKLKVIKISSPFLNNFILVGCVLLYIIVILYGMDTTNMTPLQFSIQCHTRPILLSVGLSLAFGALFMKTYRVYAIFKIAVEKFGDIRVGDSRLILGVVVMVIMDIIISVGWIVIDPMSGTVTALQTRAVTDENGHDFLYIYQSHQCYSVYTQYWTISLYVCKAVMLFLGVFLAWAIRSVQVAALNESRQIALSVYVVALVCVFIPLVQYFLTNQPTLVYAITGTGIFLANTLVLCLAFGPKILSLLENPHDVNTSTVKSGQLNKDRTSQQGWRRGYQGSKKKDKIETVDSLEETLNAKLQELAVLKNILQRRCIHFACEDQ